MLSSFILSRTFLCPSAQQHFHDSILNLLLLVTKDGYKCNKYICHKNLINSPHQHLRCGAVLLLFHQTVKNGGITAPLP